MIVGLGKNALPAIPAELNHSLQVFEDAPHALRFDDRPVVQMNEGNSVRNARDKKPVVDVVVQALTLSKFLLFLSRRGKTQFRVGKKVMECRLKRFPPIISERKFGYRRQETAVSSQPRFAFET